jgi:hypothetical protein
MNVTVKLKNWRLWLIFLTGSPFSVLCFINKDYILGFEICFFILTLCFFAFFNQAGRYLEGITWALLTILGMLFGTFLAIIVVLISGEIFSDWYVRGGVYFAIAIHGPNAYLNTVGEPLMLELMEWATIGIIISLVQWIIIKKNGIHFVEWFKVSTLSYLMPFLIIFAYRSIFPQDIINVEYGYMLIFFPALISSGCCQWWIFRRIFRLSALWIVGISLGAFLGFVTIGGGSLDSFSYPFMGFPSLYDNPFTAHLSGKHFIEHILKVTYFHDSSTQYIRDRILHEMVFGFLAGCLLGIISGIFYTFLPKRMPGAHN